MATDAATQILTGLALLLLIGLIVSIISKKINISNILLLIIVGLIMGQFTGQSSIFTFSGSFLVAIAVLTLVMVVFDGSSRFELRRVDKFSVSALKVTLLFMLLNVIFISLFTNLLFFPSFRIEYLLFSTLYAIVMTGTDPGSVFIMLKSKANKVIEFLEIEAIINTPVTVIFPFIILGILQNTQTSNVASAIVGQVVPLLQQIVVGVGSGAVIGIIVLKTMKKVYSQRFSPVGLITAALLAYILAENLDGNGVLSVATLGLFFGNSYVKEKESLQEFNSMLNSSLIILVFILIGMVIKFDLTTALFIKSLILFFVLIITRFAGISLGLRGQDFNAKEKTFMALSMPKGIAVAVVAFSLSVFSIPIAYDPLMKTVLAITILSMVYSLVLSSIIDRFSYNFIRVKLEEKD